MCAESISRGASAAPATPARLTRASNLTDHPDKAMSQRRCNDQPSTSSLVQSINQQLAVTNCAFVGGRLGLEQTDRLFGGRLCLLFVTELSLDLRLLVIHEVARLF